MEKKFKNMKWAGILLVLTMLMVAPIGVAAPVCSPVCPEGTVGDGSRKAGSGMATDDELESQKAMLWTMLAQISTVCDMLYHELGEKATPEEAPELYAKLDNIKMQIAMLGAQIDVASTMEDIMVIQGSLASLQAALEDLKMQIEEYVPGKQLTATTIEGVTMKFKVIDEAEHTAMAGTGESSKQAIDIWTTTSTGKVTIPEEVSGYRVIAISEYAFDRCRYIKEFVMPSTLQTIESRAFANCDALETVYIPKNVSKIANNAFYESAAIKSISVSPDNTTFDSRSNCNAIIETASNKLVRGCDNSFIPFGVTTIGYESFLQVHNLTYLQIPESVTNIEYRAFYSSGLVHVEALESLKIISSYAFANCKSLEYFNMPGLEWISDDAFQECTSLTEITLPSTLTTLENHAFFNCTGLKIVHSEVAEPFVIDDGVFGNADRWTPRHDIYNKAILFVPKGKVDAYKAVASWNLFGQILEEGTPIPTGVKAVAEDSRSDVTTATYTLGGQQLSTPKKGICVVKSSDGSVKKVLVK